jgi:LuxR family transcriptional regulator/LuxR family quorum-sensing system transcriptional regulator CciR
MIVDWHGFPEKFIETYLEDEMHLIDPFPAHVARHKSTLRMSDIVQQTKLSRAETAYIKRVREMGVTDGFIIPTFGMELRMAKFALGQVTDPSVLEKADLVEITATLQSAHRHLDELARQGKPIRPRLPRREVEILHWIAKGKTNPEIAIILGIAESTVATHIKRLFDKLDVNDRAAAAVKGVNYGIIGT